MDERQQQSRRDRTRKRRREEEESKEVEADDEDWEADLDVGNFVASWHSYADDSSGLKVSQVRQALFCTKLRGCVDLGPS